MAFYYPIIVTVLLVFALIRFVFKHQVIRAFILCVTFSVYIMFSLKHYDFVAYAVLGNTLFYVMAIGSFFTRPRFQHALKGNDDDDGIL